MILQALVKYYEMMAAEDKLPKQGYCTGKFYPASIILPRAQFLPFSTAGIRLRLLKTAM